MEYYRDTYKNSRRWDGKDSLEGKTVIIYMEQGLGDQIMFLRFVPLLPCKTILHCSRLLHRLFANFTCLDKDDPNLPPHDYHVLSLDLPFLLRCPIPTQPYIHVEGETDLLPGHNTGIAWTGSTDHERNEKRSCNLRHFNVFTKSNLFLLQPNIGDPKFFCEDVVVYGVPLEDFYDTAKLINSVDMIVSVDTAVLHLAGAMGKCGYGLLDPDHDARWNYEWYPTLKMLSGGWEELFAHLGDRSS